MSSSELLFAFVILADILFSGIIFGWGPLLLILIEERQYGEFCGDSHEANKICQAQENRLNLIFALASTAMNAAALPTGLLLDRFRPTILITCAAVMEITGLFLFAFADSKTFDVFVPAYVLLAAGGCITMMTSFPASFGAKHHQTAALAAISCSYDASSAIFLLAYAIHETFGVTKRNLFLSHAILGIFVYGALIILWRINEQVLYRKIPPPESRNTTVKKVSVGVLVDKSMYSPLSKKDVKRLGEQSCVQYGSLNAQNITTLHNENKLQQYHAGGVARVSKWDLLNLTIKDQMCTFEFVYILILASFHMLRTTLFIGTANKLLEVGFRCTGSTRCIDSYFCCFLELWRCETRAFLYKSIWFCATIRICICSSN